jgi:hypothetical protein
VSTGSTGPLSRKLGAKPGVGVLVFFTTSRDELWPKRAARIETDLSFEAVQEVGLAAGLVDNKGCATDDDRQAVCFVIRARDR